MKHIIAILFLCILSAQMAAQSKYTVTDTSYTTNSAGVFFAVRDIIYSNGEESHTKTLIGDTSALFDAFYNRFVQAGTQMATDARFVLTFPRKIADLKRDNDELLAITGKDAMDTITAKLSGAIMEDGWTIRQNGTPQDLAFTINNSGQLRYSVGGNTRNALFFGAVLRLNNYNGADDLELYRVESGNYKSIDNKITLRRPGGPANRSAAPPPQEAANTAPATKRAAPAPEVKKQKVSRKKKKQ